MIPDWEDYDIVMLDSYGENKKRFKVKDQAGDVAFYFEIYSSHPEINRTVINVYYNSRKKYAVSIVEPGLNAMDILDKE